MIFLWIIVAFIVFSIVILVHEWWHFAAARKFWVKVEEFWLWIPPRAKKLFYDKKWTLFSLNWLPIWWFVRLKWEQINTYNVYDKNWKIYNNEQLEIDLKKWEEIYNEKWEILDLQEKEEILKWLIENSSDENIANKPNWQQAIIILAWVFMNFVLAFFIFFILFLIGIKPIWINNKIETNHNSQIIPTYEQAIENWALKVNSWVILYPISWSFAEKNGIIEWDILYKIWDKYIKNPSEVIDIVTNSKNEEIIFQFEDKNITIEIPGDWKIWSYISENISINEDYLIKYGFLNSWKYALIETKTQIMLTFKWIWILLKNIFNPDKPEDRKEAIENMSWPIGIVDFISSSISAWFIFIIIIWAIISINLWVFNLLPIPALDWWRFIFITINSILTKVFWKKFLSNKVEWLIHFIFFVILIALSLIIAYNDINKIIS